MMDKSERPSEAKINEDVLLDKWLEEYEFKRKQEMKGIGKGKKRKQHQETVTF